MAKPRTFREAVEQFEKAVREDAWKGAKHPGDHAELTQRYKETKNNLIEYFASRQEKAFHNRQGDARTRAANKPGFGDMGG